MNSVFKEFPPTPRGQKIFVFQSANTRAFNIGFIQKQSNHPDIFIPGRLLFGAKRGHITFQATVETLKIPHVLKTIKSYPEKQISTITVMRETLACRIFDALDEAGIENHFGDAFIGATHIKDKGPIKTAYLYENIEGLAPGGLWIVADSLCIGRNLYATLQSLFKKMRPQEIIFLSLLASRRAIHYIDGLLAKYDIPATYLTWGALFGVSEKNLYDMPWGHKDTEPLDMRDQKLYTDMYGDQICVGGDFGNNYYSPTVALELYDAQLEEHKVIPKIPTAQEVLKIYLENELFINQVSA